MELVAAVTLWTLVTVWFLFPLWGVPRLLVRAAVALLAAELVALLAWSYGSEGCDARPCSPLAEMARVAASRDLPALELAVIGLAALWGARRTQRERDARGTRRRAAARRTRRHGAAR